MTRLVQKAFISEAHKAGLAVLDVTLRKAGHYCITLCRVDGQTMKYFAPSTASDQKASLNRLSCFKRFAADRINFIQQRSHV